MPCYPITNFEVLKYYQNEPKFNGVYSTSNLCKLKDGSYLIILDDYKSNGTRWVPAYVIGDNVTYFDSFGFEYIPKEIKIFTSKRNIINIYRIQAKDSIICGYFCIDLLILC